MLKAIQRKNIEGLAWYKDAYNHGRGKLSAEANRLVKAGYLRLKWLSARDWVLTITAKGAEALKAVEK